MAFDRFVKPFLAGALLATALMAAPQAPAATTTLLNVSYDPTRELYDDYNKAFVEHWKQQTGKDVVDPPVARRLRQAGAHRDRRPAGRRGHARAGLRHRCARDAGQAAAGQLAVAAAAQQLAVHVDDRVPGAQGQPEEDQGLGRPRASPGSRSSRRTRRPPAVRAGTISPPGPGRSSSRAAARRRPSGSSASSTRTCRCSTPAPAAR